ncbi:hypothetical protein [Streptomyces sp. NPDC057382]|uniref:hypothetical protein n=1 Tax=unclassified Streptomyces TaxID=2593676 RepID=UPI00363D2C6A
MTSLPLIGALILADAGVCLGKAVPSFMDEHFSPLRDRDPDGDRNSTWGLAKKLAAACVIVAPPDSSAVTG